MNRNTIRRKVIYLAILVAMLIPLYLLGQPADRNDAGGQLSAMRLKYDIAESNLGEISPSSETMKLASLGLRGVAATMLWSKANQFQIEHEWDRHRATVNNIALLQPHFEKVWEYQAHNLTYNISKEFDDYRQRYEMVREGSEFLIGGVRQNRNAPRLVWYTGWFYGAKIGMADEKRQFRRLFREDEVGHENLLDENIPVDSPEARGPDGRPDNWLVGRLWLNEGYDLVDSGVPVRRQTPLNFFETGPKWRIKHAESIESEGVLDDGALTAWQLAAEDWSKFGNRSIPTTAAFTIKLDQLDELKQQKAEKLQQFRELAPEVYDARYRANYEALGQQGKDLLAKKESDLNFVEVELVEKYRAGLVPPLMPLVEQFPQQKRLRAVELVDQINDLEERIIKTRGYREQINYGYWKSLAQAEQEERTVRARKLVFDAEAANAKADPFTAKELYEEAFALWAEIFDDYPVLTIDDTAEDLARSIRRYFVLVDSDELPDDFPLKTFAELMGEYGEVPANAYAEVRASQKRKAEQRKRELEEAERLLEQREGDLDEDKDKEQEEVGGGANVEEVVVVVTNGDGDQRDGGEEVGDSDKIKTRLPAIEEVPVD